jgi:hypothetical protein
MWAIWRVDPLNEPVYQTTLDFIASRPAKDRVICFEGTYGMHRGLRAWSARIRPKSEVRKVRVRNLYSVWIDPADDAESWTTPYSDFYSN